MIEIDKDFLMRIVLDNKEVFPPDFIGWIPLNSHIFSEFCRRAIMLKNTGRKHYGAKGIVESIRFDTCLRSRPDYDFKCNNNHTSYLARLAVLVYSELNGFFELRDTRKS